MINSISGSSLQGMNSMSAIQQTLTDDQKQAVSDILSEYDPENLTQADKKSIMDSFRQEGIRPGRALDEAVEELGFDSKSLKPKPPAGGPPPAPAGKGGKSINSESLQTLQNILEEYDLTNLSEEDTESLMSELTSAGLTETGTTVDLRV
jgi:hypothetical protein